MAQVFLESRHSVPWAYVTSMTPRLPQQNEQSDQIEPQQNGVAKGSLIDHLENLIPRVEQMGEVRRKIQSNGHFKDFPPEA